MNDKILKLIGQSKEDRDVLQTFLIAELEKQAGKDALSGKDTSGYKEAKQCILKSMDILQVTYSEKKVKEVIHRAV